MPRHPRRLGFGRRMRPSSHSRALGRWTISRLPSLANGNPFGPWVHRLRCADDADFVARKGGELDPVVEKLGVVRGRHLGTALFVNWDGALH